MKTPKIIVNNRDLKIFSYLFEQKVASQKVIFENFFSKRAQNTMVGRLQKLFREKLIGKSGCDLNGRMQIYYSLKLKGFKAIEQDFIFDTPDPYLKSDSIEHDLEICEIRNKLESYEMVDQYYSENYLQNCCFGEKSQVLLPLRELNADAGIVIKTNDGKFTAAVEYERRRKTADKYAKKFNDYYLRDDITAVFYICETKEIAKMIAKVDREIGAGFRAKIYTTMREDMSHLEKKLPLKNSNEDIFILK